MDRKNAIIITFFQKLLIYAVALLKFVFFSFRHPDKLNLFHTKQTEKTSVNEE